VETLTAGVAGTQRLVVDEASRVDALVLRQFEEWSIPELREYVELADRDTGGYARWCHEQACAVLERRTRSFNADFMRYSMIEDGCADFAGMTDAEVTSAFRGLGVDEAAYPEDEGEDEEPERWDSCS
jgi:hypothetical protein